uniref:Uncharacterized protein n=1 Tax=Arundo donax TaxID=35708 RepID=A0A0A9B7C0_ARUDO
MKKTNLIRG